MMVRQTNCLTPRPGPTDEREQRPPLPDPLLQRRRGRTSDPVDGFIGRIGIAALFVVVCLFIPTGAGAEAMPAEFEQANKLYEQGKFKEAADVYERLIDRGIEAPGLYFNLGNAWYKAGQNGRAVAAYLRAERLAPRDPAIRFNLDFVRRKVTGQAASVPFWQRW